MEKTGKTVEAYVSIYAQYLVEVRTAAIRVLAEDQPLKQMGGRTGLWVDLPEG